MAKMIKFDLPIDGVKVATLDDLRDHFTTETIGHFRSGLLARWLRSRSMTRELAAVEALTVGDDAAVLKELCRIFEMEADDDTIAAAIAEATGVPGTRLRRQCRELHVEFITLYYYVSWQWYMLSYDNMIRLFTTAGWRSEMEEKRIDPDGIFGILWDEILDNYRFLLCPNNLPLFSPSSKKDYLQLLRIHLIAFIDISLKDYQNKEISNDLRDSLVDFFGSYCQSQYENNLHGYLHDDSIQSKFIPSIRELLS